MNVHVSVGRNWCAYFPFSTVDGGGKGICHNQIEEKKSMNNKVESTTYAFYINLRDTWVTKY